MTMHARDGGTWRTITLPSVRVAGVWTAVSEGWTRVSGVWQQFYSAVAALGASIAGSAFGTRSGLGSVTTNSVTCVPAGGTFPYSFQWTYVSGNTFTINSQTSATTSFTTTVNIAQTKTADYRCTVTDSLGATASATVNVSVSETS